MNMTSLIVELLVVGVGTFTWLFMLLDSTLQLKLPSNNLYVIPYTALIYLLGVITDRIYRNISIQFVENKVIYSTWKRAVAESKYHRYLESMWKMYGRGALMRLEKVIRYHSGSLDRKVNYNRSRLRVCRSWTINLPIIALSYVYWGYSKETFVSFPYTELMTLILIAVASGYTTMILSKDHVKDLIGSFEVIQDEKESTG